MYPGQAASVFTDHCVISHLHHAKTLVPFKTFSSTVDKSSSNLNNYIKSIYMSMIICLWYYAFAVLVNYTDIYFLLCLNTAEDNMVLYQDELGNGFKDYIDLKLESLVYNFICTYVRRLKPNAKWKKLLMKTIHLYDNTEQHCICVGNHQEWKGYVGAGQESRNKSREKGKAAIQCGRGNKEREWHISVEQERAGVLFHGGENLERGVQFQGAIFCTDQWVGELGAQGQEQGWCYKDILDEGGRGGQEDGQQEE